MTGHFKSYLHVGLALDPVHVGSGGSRLGRVDNTIVRDPVTRIPKIPGSSFAGVYRTYAAMAISSGGPLKCVGQGQRRADGSGGHCGRPDCPICTVFGFARGNNGGFTGLAAFSDGHVLLFPVATRQGPLWVTSPIALRVIEKLRDFPEVTEHAVYLRQSAPQPLNLGWLMLPVMAAADDWPEIFETIAGLGVPGCIAARIGIISDRLFTHVVNSNLEVRTSVAINPASGAAEEGQLFIYEALPRGTVLVWEVTCRNPVHFRIDSGEVAAVKNVDDVHVVVSSAHPYLEHLGIGGMGTRGMGRLRVLSDGRVEAEDKGKRQQEVP